MRRRRKKKSLKSFKKVKKKANYKENMGILGISHEEPVPLLPQTKRATGTERRATGTIVPVLGP